jgi:hypothetical protein
MVGRSVPRCMRENAHRDSVGASDYGNEKEAGEGVARAIKDGLVKREDLCELLWHARIVSS